MSYHGTVTCSYCYNRGHNQRGCPEIKAEAEKVMAAAKAAGIDPLKYKDVWATYRNGKLGSEDISWTEMWAYDKHREKQQAVSKPRRCSWCKEGGHNKRSCQRRKDDLVRLRQALAFQHKLAQVFAEAKGLVPGNLLMQKDRFRQGNQGEMYLVESIRYCDFDYFMDRLVTARDASEVDALLVQTRMYDLEAALVSIRTSRGRTETFPMSSFYGIRNSWTKPVHFQFYPTAIKAPTKGSLISELKQETVDRYKVDCGVKLYGRFSYHDRDHDFKAIADEFLEIIQGVSVI